jgi:calcium-translocating P-type ATPase
MYNTTNINWHALSIEEVLSELAANLQVGLTASEVLTRQEIYGFNLCVAQKPESIFWRFLRQFNNVLVYILLVSAMITVCLTQWVDTSVILGVVVLNAIFGFIQEGKAQKALEAIRAMLAPTTQVIRNGQRIVISTVELVPGDLVVIHRGDKIPADLRVGEAKNLQAQEAILTGESLPVDKQVMPVLENTLLSERGSMLYSGTLVTNGRGLGIVVATGSNTEVGKIGTLLAHIKSVDTPLLRQMNVFGHWLTALIVAIGVMVFVVGALVWHDSSTSMFMAVVSLIVAAVPEGLPPIMTIILAIGIARMAKQNAIVRRMPAVETMGAVTTICTDKTGTLTGNELTAQFIVTTQQQYLNDDETVSDHPDLKAAIISGILCNEAELYSHDSSYKARGNPIDVALMMLGLQAKFDVHLWQQKLPRIDLIPYETEHKFMATLHHDHTGQGFIYIKGAPEIILKKCKTQAVCGTVVSLDAIYWQQAIERLTSVGQRVIAVAYKTAEAKKLDLLFDDVNDDLILVALFGLIDPPRSEAILAVKECQHAGINVKMITGDHAMTAAAIAEQVGIVDCKVLTGDELDAMSDQELAKIAPNINVYARTAPQHKLRLVKALQSQGEIVAMTGDGVNDAPALKQADIGIAMGHKGADIAKESADMVLADDDFATIVHAVSEGRTIYDNLQKAIIFILPTSFAQAFVVIVAILFRLALPITAVQILWVNMITAVTLSLALGFEPAEHDVMCRSPRNPNIPLLSWFLIGRSFFVSVFLVASVFGLFLLEHNKISDLAVARTVAVNMLVFGEIFYLVNCRNLKNSSLHLKTFFGSFPVLSSIVVVVLFQLLFTYTPLMQRFFGTTAIGLMHWSYIIAAAGVFFGLVELEKFLLRHTTR